MNGNTYILLIEDNEIDALLAKQVICIEEPNLEIVRMENGQKGLEYLENCDLINNPPLLILLDLQMPICDGFKFMELYNKRFYPSYPSISIFVLTSSINELEKKKSLSYPFVKNVIEKPFTRESIKKLTSSVV